MSEFISTHNDILTAFIGFGLVGLILYLYYIIVLPIKNALGRNKITVILMLVYFVIECCMMEPFFRGNIIVVLVNFYIMKYACINSRAELSKTQ